MQVDLVRPTGDVERDPPVGVRPDVAQPLGSQRGEVRSPGHHDDRNAGPVQLRGDGRTYGTRPDDDVSGADGSTVLSHR